MNPKLFRTKDRILAGVCGGLAAFFSLDPSLVRIGFVLFFFFSFGFPTVALYVIMWFIIPNEL